MVSRCTKHELLHYIYCSLVINFYHKVEGLNSSCELSGLLGEFMELEVAPTDGPTAVLSSDSIVLSLYSI